MRYRATIRAGGRSYSEILDLDEELEDWEEIEDQFEHDFDHHYRPMIIPYRKIDDLSGDHVLYGWFEAMMQSDRSPWFALTENNDAQIMLEFD